MAQDKYLYRVGTFRAAGLKARWTETWNGGPIIQVRRTDEDEWIYVDRNLWSLMNEFGVMEGFITKDMQTYLNSPFFLRDEKES